MSSLPESVVCLLAVLAPSYAWAGGLPAIITPNPGSTPQSARAGYSFIHELAATVTDATGAPVSGISVVFTAPSTGASGTFLSSGITTTVQTDANGIASVVFNPNSIRGGPYVVTAAATGLPTINFSLSNTAAGQSPAAYSGSGQTGVTTRTLRQPFILQWGGPVAGVSITFTVVPSGGASGSFIGGGTSVTVATDTQGYATSPLLTTNNVAGSFSVTASDGINALLFDVGTTTCLPNPPSVSSASDSSTDSTTLRYAVTNACAGSAITFADGLSTIRLNSRLRIDDSLTIKGPGANNLALDGDGNSRLFFIGNGTVLISGLTLKNGLGKGGDSHEGGGAAGMGGAVFQNGGNLVFTNVTFTNNVALGGSGINPMAGGGGGGFGGNAPPGDSGADGGDLFGIGGLGGGTLGFGYDGGPGAGGGVGANGPSGGFGGGGPFGLGLGGFGGVPARNNFEALAVILVTVALC